jgi:hypothetical protein
LQVCPKESMSLLVCLLSVFLLWFQVPSCKLCPQNFFCL